jgi:hypothetical protein
VAQLAGLGLLRFSISLYVCFGSKADICGATAHVRFTPNSDIDCVLRRIRFAPQADIVFELTDEAEFGVHLQWRG